jgi:hypothetical protein
MHEPFDCVAEVLIASYLDQLGCDLFKRASGRTYSLLVEAGRISERGIGL